MGQLADAVKAAAAVFGSGRWSSGDAAGRPANDVFTAAMDGGLARSLVDSMDAGDLYATQPHLRTVVSFVARNAAQLGRHVYTKDADDSRRRVSDSALAELLKRPNDYMTGYDLFNMLFSELALYDMAVWVPVLRDGRWEVDPIPGEWITGMKKADAFRQAGYRVKYPHKNEEDFLPADSVIVFRGYSPNGFQRGSSAVRSLRATLGEQVAAINFREQLWRRGGRVGMFMTRPKDAPAWSKEAQQKFIQTWRTQWSGSGENAGSTPLLEDGMELKRLGFNAKEEQWLEAATLSLSTVAGAYHVPPAMVGVSGYNSFASVKEFRKMLYTETLGPLIAQVESTINEFLLPFIGEPKDHYLELNIQEKLQGDFEEQAAVMQAAVGGPYMTADEARARVNLPKIDGGDKLLAPLNMGAAGNSGPLADEPIDSGAPESEPPEEDAKKSQKARSTDPRDGEQASKSGDETLSPLEQDLKDYFERVKRVTLGKLGEKDQAWWDEKKWNQELSSVLFPHLLKTSAGTARRVAGAKGLNPDDYSPAQTEKFLKAVADSRAGKVNATVRDHYQEALDNGSDLSEVYADTESHAKTVGTTLTTFVTAWATVEVAKQLVPDKRPQKTWVGSGLPNSRHADMDGETVPIDEPFSNGAMWPGDPVLGPGEVANCGCGVDITYND